MCMPPRPGEFSQNTLTYNGDNMGINENGRVSTISMNHMQFQCWGFIKHDGAVVHGICCSGNLLFREFPF